MRKRIKKGGKKKIKNQQSFRDGKCLQGRFLQSADEISRAR